MTGSIESSDVIDAFKTRGFELVGTSPDGWFRLSGCLTPPEMPEYPCEVQLDPRFFELPRVRLLKLPPNLPAAVPHLGADGSLCYIAKGTVVLDIFDPIGQSLACLERAAMVWGKVLKGEMVEDLAEEFFAYWGGQLCMLDLQSEALGRQGCIVAECNEKRMLFVTDNEERTKRKLALLGYTSTELTVPTFRVKTKAQPRPLINKWPPQTVQDILEWQGTLDPGCRRKIHERIKQQAKKKSKGLLILIESPLLTYGFAVAYDHTGEAPNTKSSHRIDKTISSKVIMLSVLRIDDRYLAERNVPNLKTLAGKNIALVGCGTIGGYLSEMLIKAGVGTSGGRLTLVDMDHLFPQNIGRHRLGFPALFSNKATAMEDELRRLAPGAEIRALPTDVRHTQLGELDLLIDASGEEALGHWLCKFYLKKVPMLSVWIEGAGSAARALLRIHNSGACYRCLWHSSKRGELRSLSDLPPIVLAGFGCEGLYVPFPPSVSVRAASLAADMVLDWANEIYSPSLRTRILQPNLQLATEDCDPLPDRDCPLCNS